MERALYMAMILIATACSTGVSVSNEDTIGLSKHIRYMRYTPDTAVVTTMYTGWTVDSIRITDKRMYRKDTFRKTFNITGFAPGSYNDSLPFKKTCGWLTIECTERVMTFTAPTTSSECDEDRHALVFLHKDKFRDSIKIIQSGEWIGGIVSANDKNKEKYSHDYIDLWPNSMRGYANGGKKEFTTKGTDWWIAKIEFYNGDTSKEDWTYIPSEKEIARWRNGIGFKRSAKVRYVTITNEGKELEVSVKPNRTDKRRRFNIFLACNENSCPTTLYGEQNAKRTKKYTPAKRKDMKKRQTDSPRQNTEASRTPKRNAFTNALKKQKHDKKHP